MSSLESKLERPAPLTQSGARATRKQLEARWAELEELHLLSMGKTEVWRKVSGTGASAVFEQLMDGQREV